jgi:hypothetical protein
MLDLALERNLTLMVRTALTELGPVEVLTVDEEVCVFQANHKLKALTLDEIQGIQVAGLSD